MGSSIPKPAAKNALRLRPLKPGDEKALRAYLHAHKEENLLSKHGFPNDMPCSELAEKLHAMTKGKGLPKGWVPCTILFAEVDSQFVGRLEIRHKMTPELRKYGTMIGYA